MCSGILGIHGCKHYSAMRYTAHCIPSKPCKIPVGRAQSISYQCPICDIYDQALLQHTFSLPGLLDKVTRHHKEGLENRTLQHTAELEFIAKQSKEGKLGLLEMSGRIAIMETAFERVTKEAVELKVANTESVKMGWLVARKEIMAQWMQDVDEMRVVADDGQKLRVCVSPI